MILPTPLGNSFATVTIGPRAFFPIENAGTSKAPHGSGPGIAAPSLQGFACGGRGPVVSTDTSTHRAHRTHLWLVLPIDAVMVICAVA